MDERIIERPPILIYEGDIDRIRQWGIAHNYGDSATTLRAILTLVEQLGRRHKTMSKEELLSILDDIRASVAADDSFEGSIEYLMPEPLGLDPTADFAVVASYRVGNAMGQGGVRLIRADE